MCGQRHAAHLRARQCNGECFAVREPLSNAELQQVAVHDGVGQRQRQRARQRERVAEREPKRVGVGVGFTLCFSNSDGDS